jgi:hypothetical protein
MSSEQNSEEIGIEKQKVPPQRIELWTFSLQD